MRNRSDTIYATNEHEFIEHMKSNDKRNIIKFKRSKISINLEKITQDNDSLSSTIPFQLEEKPLTLLERERLEEEILEKTLKELGYSLRNNDKESFYRNIMDLKKESLHSKSHENDLNFQNRQTFLSCLEKITSFGCSKINMSSFKDCYSSIDTTDSLKHIICQNIEITKDKIKVMVIGEKHVGKSLFISRYTNSFKQDYCDYPFESFEIKHHLIDHLGKLTKVEFWDVSTKLLNSPLIKTYFQICDAFILICNTINKNSIRFVQRELEKIINARTSDELPNVLIIANEYENAMMNKEHLNNIEYLNQTILKRFDLPLFTINLSKSELINCGVEKFLTNVSLKKVKRQRKKGRTNIDHIDCTKVFREKLLCDLNIKHTSSEGFAERTSSSVEKYLKNIF